MLTLTAFLVLAAAVLTLTAAANKTPLWVAVLLITLAVAVGLFPVR